MNKKIVMMTAVAALSVAAFGTVASAEEKVCRINTFTN